MRLIDQGEVRRRLTYEACIPIVREAMIALLARRNAAAFAFVIPLARRPYVRRDARRAGRDGAFGAKLISVYPENFAQGPPVASGRGRAVRSGNRRAGLHRACGRDHRHPHRRGQRRRHRCARASRRVPPRDPGLRRTGANPCARIGKVRPLDSISVWGRSPGRAEQVRFYMEEELGIPSEAAGNAEEAVRDADIICTVTAAAEPILGRLGRARHHVNVVGSGLPAPPKSTPTSWPAPASSWTAAKGVLAQGANSCAPKSGAIDDTHIVGRNRRGAGRATRRAGTRKAKSLSTNPWATSCRTSPAPGRFMRGGCRKRAGGGAICTYRRFHFCSCALGNAKHAFNALRISDGDLRKRLVELNSSATGVLPRVEKVYGAPRNPI